MTAAVPASTWRPLAHRLANEIEQVGKLRTPSWRRAIENVPRHVFVPSYLTDERHGAHHEWISHQPTDPESVSRWLELVYSRTTLVTDVAEFADRGIKAAVSISTKPDLMVRMLEALEVADGMRVLEIGTGTGYNAALLSHRLGDQNVYSIDIDSVLVSDARARLMSIGYCPTLVTGDGAAGLADHAPFDRIIATCALFGFPCPWIGQLRTDGLALVHVEGPLGAGNLMALRHIAPDTVQGRFLPWWGCFMRRRSTAGATVGTPRPRRTTSIAMTRRTTVDPANLDGGQRFPLLAQVHLPPGLFRSIRRDDNGRTTTELRALDGSWCRVDRDADDDRNFTLQEAGPTSLWAAVELAWREWTELGAPEWHEFGLTVTSRNHRLWYGSPDGPSWPFPDPPATI